LKSPIAPKAGLDPAPKLKSVAALSAIDELGIVTSRKTVFEPPPPELGLTTVTEAVPGLATSEERTAAFSWDSLTNVVARALPFHFTTEPETNPEPLTVKMNPAAPGLTASGTSGWLISGTGFCATATPVIASENSNRHPTAKQKVLISDMRSLYATTPPFALVSNAFTSRNE
jgi:hypothetical protein